MTHSLYLNALQAISINTNLAAILTAVLAHKVTFSFEWKPVRVRYVLITPLFSHLCLKFHRHIVAKMNQNASDSSAISGRLAGLGCRCLIYKPLIYNLLMPSFQPPAV